MHKKEPDVNNPARGHITLGSNTYVFTLSHGFTELPKIVGIAADLWGNKTFLPMKRSLEPGVQIQLQTITKNVLITYWELKCNWPVLDSSPQISKIWTVIWRRGSGITVTLTWWSFWTLKTSKSGVLDDRQNSWSEAAAGNRETVEIAVSLRFTGIFSRNNQSFYLA